MIKPLIPPLQEWGAPSVLDMQEVFNAIQFMLGTGCPVAGDMQGNPPFVGAKFQTSDQHALVRRIASHWKNGGTLDYVAGRFIMAGDYVNGGDARIGFVATNLITAGEQVTREDVTAPCVLAAHHGFKVPRGPPDMTIASFVVLTGGLAGFHPSKRQPLPGTQKLWEGVRFLSHAVIAMRAMQEWDRNQSEGEKDTDSSVLD